MGHKYALASRLRLKKDTPLEVIQLLDFIYGVTNRWRHVPPAFMGGKSYYEKAGRIAKELKMWWYSYETWYWHVKEEHETFYLYESRSSSKPRCTVEFLDLVKQLQTYLVLDEGEIVYRCLTEEPGNEWVICFKGSQFKEQKGYEYTYFPEEDKDMLYHPLFDERLTKYLGAEEIINRRERPGQYIELPWNIADIKT